MRFALPIVLAALAAGCSSGSDRSVLREGIRPGVPGKVVVIGDREARKTGRTVESWWLANLEKRAKAHPRERFDNPNRADFRRKLSGLARDDGFEVVSAKVLRPLQDAPLVIVRTTHYLDLARSTQSILRELNPRDRGGDGEGWHYEGFYWEARDERGVPFLVASTLTRGQVEGQQWARSEALYPYRHG